MKFDQIIPVFVAVWGGSWCVVKQFKLELWYKSFRWYTMCV